MPTINILNGDSAAGGFLQAFPAERKDILVFRDVLSCGPLYPFNNLKQWQSERLSYWELLSQENGLAGNDHASNNDFYEDFLTIEESAQIRLWLGMGLSEQLLLCFVVFLFDRLNMDIGRLSVVQFSGNWGQKFKLPLIGLGLLKPNEIAQHPEPFLLDQKQQDYAIAAWQAFSSHNPQDYVRFMALEETSLPLLHQAMSLVKLRYPDIINGLSLWDQLLLENTRLYGPKATQILGYTMADKTLALDSVGDWYLFNRLIRMADIDTKKPLLIMKTSDKQMRSTGFQLTDFGEQVLNNQTNNFKENGIDDWIGGVHLNAADSQLWCRNDKQQLVSSDLH